MTDSPDKLWNASDVSNYLDCSISLVYKMARSSLIPSLRPSPGVLRFNPDSIKLWANSQHDSK